jgi:hypothetical protein
VNHQQALAYIQQVATDYLNTLAPSARVAVLDKINEAFKVLLSPPPQQSPPVKADDHG